MGRSGYTDDYADDQWALIRWRGAVKSALRGKRGQAFLRELIAALEALPERKLIAGELEREDGCVCGLGAVGRARGLDMTGIDAYDREQVAHRFGVAEAMAAEAMYVNDEWCLYRDDDEKRWRRVHEWATSKLVSGDPCEN